MGYGGSERVLRFGVMVRAHRLEAGLTQQELAAKAGLSVATLRDFEQYRRLQPRASSVAALANALGLDPAQAADLTRAAASQPRKSRDGAEPLCSPRTGFSRAAGSMGPDQGLWLTALGPLEAWRDRKRIPLGPPARQAVLGMLLMDPGKLVRRETIIDALWKESPPSTAVELVQAHVSRLRRALASWERPAGDDGLIDSARGAYRLRLSTEELDLLVFRDLATRAAAAQADGDDETACNLYEHAVGLWRGDPLADVDMLRCHYGLTILRQQLSGVLLRYADVAFKLGQYHRVLPRLHALAAKEPLNEPVHARLMIAMAGSGQQAAAIRIYEDLRLHLDRELGLYPGEELVEAHVRVLRQDIPAMESRESHARRAVLPATVPVVPRQLPAALRYFTGRAGELDMLSGLVGRDCAEANGVVIAALTGMAGIGKTALAVHWAHQVASRFPNGQLFVNLRGFCASGTPVTPTEAICGFLTALGVPATRIPVDTTGQAALWRSLLVGRRMLIVLDNARDAEQVRMLLPGSPGCLVVVTSRNRLTGLAAAEGAQLLPLEVLTESESRDLLTRSLTPGRAMAEPSAVSELIGLCAKLPLALCNIAARAAARPRLPLAALATEMREERGRLDALETGESATSVRKVFSWSRASLSDLAGQMFCLLGLHTGPDITIPAAASLAGLSRNQASKALAELCDGHLVTEHAPHRYICHDLLRTYAAEWACIRESDTERREAIHRLLDHYLHTANAASAILHPDYVQSTCTQPRAGVRPEKLDGPRHATEWFENERHVLLAAISKAAEEAYTPHAWELPWAAGPFFTGEVYWRKFTAIQETALAVASEQGDPAGQALACHHLGLLRLWLGERDNACEHLDVTLSRPGNWVPVGAQTLA